MVNQSLTSTPVDRGQEQRVYVQRVDAVLACQSRAYRLDMPSTSSSLPH